MLSRAASKLVSGCFQRAVHVDLSQHGYRYSFNIQFSTNTNKDTCKQVEVISLSLTHLASSTSSRPRKRLGKMSGGSRSRSCTCQECCAGIHPQILLARCKAPHVHTSKMRARSPSSCALTAPQKCEYMALPLPPGAIPGASPAVRSGHRESASAKGEG